MFPIATTQSQGRIIKEAPLVNPSRGRYGDIGLEWRRGIRLSLECRKHRRLSLASVPSLSRHSDPAHRKSWPQECLIPSITN